MSFRTNLATTVSRLSVVNPATLLTPLIAGQYGLDGRWIDSAYEETSFPNISVQRAEGEDLKLLPEGLRTEEVVKVFSPVKLLPTQKDGFRGHRIRYDGVFFEVKWASNRLDNGEFCVALAVKVDF